MKILPLALAAALAMHASFALAQSTGSGISVLPPAKETGKETTKDTRPQRPVIPPPIRRPLAARPARDSDWTSPTAGNPGIQSGRVK